MKAIIKIEIDVEKYIEDNKIFDAEAIGDIEDCIKGSELSDIGEIENINIKIVNK